MFKLSFTSDDLKRVIWTFIQAFLGGLFTGLAGLAAVPSSWTAAKAVGLGLVVGALAAAASAVKNLVLADGTPLK